MIQGLARKYSQKARSNRGELFIEYLNPTPTDKILDLGGGNGDHIASILTNTADNVYIADIDVDDLRHAEHQYGFKTILLDEDGSLPYPDQFFDIVFCSSVIEHVTVKKSDLTQYRTTEEFTAASLSHQMAFSQELRRVAKRYFVQTPNKYFLIESHTWLPGFIVLLPRSMQIRLIKTTNKFWPKKTSPDWNLLTKKQMQTFFPEAEVVVEKSFGTTKSLMAIKK